MNPAHSLGAPPASGKQASPPRRFLANWLGANSPLQALLAGSPLAQRALALGVMVATTILATHWLLGGEVIFAVLGVIFSGMAAFGLALIGLPRVMGWPGKVTGRLTVVAITLSLISMLALMLAINDTVRMGSSAWMGVAVLGGLLFVLPFLTYFTRQSRALRPLIRGALGLLLGSLMFNIGAMGTFAYCTTLGIYQVVLVLLLAVWPLACFTNAWAARFAFRWAGHLLNLRSGMISVGGLLSGLAILQLAIPGLSERFYRLAFGTPLESLAPWTAILLGMLAVLLLAGATLLLPNTLVRRQLDGRLSASAAGETAWFAALGLLAANLPWLVGMAFQLDKSQSSIQENLLNWSLIATLAVLSHSVARAWLGRSISEPGTPLWLILPDIEPFAASLDTAEALTRAWKAGPVTLIAAPRAALSIRGPHLRLAQRSGLLARLFPRTASDAGEWLRSLPDTSSRANLPMREAYCEAEAARTLLATLPPDAAVLVLREGTLADGWAAVLAELPGHAEGLARTTDAMPSSGAEAWKVVDFSVPARRKELVTSFVARHSPPEPALRRMLIIHRSDDNALAWRLAALLIDRIDSKGRKIQASTFTPPVSALEVMAWPTTIWEMLLSMFARTANSGRLGRFNKLIWSFAFIGLGSDDDNEKLELLVIDSGMNSEDFIVARGMEGMVDTVVGLLPAHRPDGAPLLYRPEAYTGTLSLPLASAIDIALPGLAQRIVNEDYAAPAGSRPESLQSQAAAELPEASGAPDAPPAEAIMESPAATTRAQEIDPIVNAEDHIARGELEHAEELLNQALMDDPASSHIALKLLELLGRRGDLDRFNATLDHFRIFQHPQPEEIEDLRRKLWLPVFISYVSPYARWRNLLEDALLARRINVRSDRLLAPGDPWQEALSKLLESSSMMVAVVGTATDSSRYAQDEINVARQRGIRIIPVFVTAFGEPASLREFQGANRRPLADLDDTELEFEINATADAIAELALTLPRTTSQYK